MNNKFTHWSQLIMCDKIKANEKVVLMVILNCNNMGWSYIAHSEIMRQSGLSESTTKRVLTKLKKIGLINEVKSDVNNMNNYIVSGFNLNGLMENEPYEDSQVGSKLTTSGFNLTYKNKRNKKENIVKRVKENIKEKRESNEMINGKLNRKDEVKEKQSNNNMNFNKNGIYMELNSHPAVQSKDWTKETKEEKTHSSSAGTTKVIQIGDTRYAVKTANTDYSSIWDSFPGGTASRENNKVQRATTTEDRKDNTLSNASLHNENEDNPKATKPTTAGQNTNPKTSLNNPKTAGATETAHSEVLIPKVDNYPIPTEKTPQERNNEGNRDTHNPMDCGGMSIDDLEDIYNGGNPISKVRSQTTSKAKSNEGGGGRKFTPRKEWELLMENINTKVNNNIRPTRDEMNIIMEGARDKYRVITTLKVIYKMLFFRIKVNGYGVILTTCGDTLDDNKEAYTHKQYDFAWSTYDQCVDQFDIFKLENPTLNQ